jgi:hypothetical protein
MHSFFSASIFIIRKDRNLKVNEITCNEEKIHLGGNTPNV